MKSTGSRITLAVLNALGFLGTVVVNGLANTLPINNKNTGQLSDQYPNLFVPAGLTFSIWALIYLLLAVFTVYQLIAAVRRHERSVALFDKIGVLFLVSSIANIGWIFAWHYEIVWLSLILMAALLLSLVALYQRLSIGRSNAPIGEKICVHLPFSVYLGWITIATIANVTALLVDSRWNRFGLSEPFWTVAVIAVGIAIALGVLFSRRDIFYALVVDWAFLGIMLKRLAVDSPPILSVRIVAIVGLALISLGILAQIARRKVY